MARKKLKPNPTPAENPAPAALEPDFSANDPGEPAAANEPTFQTIAASPGSESVLSGNHLLYSLGGGADYLVTRRESGSMGVVLGMRAGMLFAPNRTTWTSGGRAVTAGPDASAGGPFVRVVVGIGGR